MTCSYCEQPAEVRCKKHGIYLCGCVVCKGLHDFSIAPYKWQCSYVDPKRFSPMDWVVAIGAAVVVASGVIITLAHYWRVQ